MLCSSSGFSMTFTHALHRMWFAFSPFFFLQPFSVPCCTFSEPWKAQLCVFLPLRAMMKVSHTTCGTLRWNFFDEQICCGAFEPSVDEIDFAEIALLSFCSRFTLLQRCSRGYMTLRKAPLLLEFFMVWHHCLQTFFVTSQARQSRPSSIAWLQTVKALVDCLVTAIFSAVTTNDVSFSHFRWYVQRLNGALRSRAPFSQSFARDATSRVSEWSRRRRTDPLSTNSMKGAACRCTVLESRKISYPCNFLSLLRTIATRSLPTLEPLPAPLGEHLFCRSVANPHGVLLHGTMRLS